MYQKWAAEHGIGVDNFQMDGKVHRFAPIGKKKKSGWYVAFDSPIKVIVAGDWATGYKWTWKEDRKYSREESKQIKEIQKSAQERAEKERKTAQDAAALLARTTIQKASKIGSHEYLQRKHVGAFGIYFLDGEILIPTRNLSDTILGYQKITKDGKKFFLKDQITKGLFHKIQGAEDIIFICEGYATGASIHMATGATVYCAFNANNLVHVASAVRKSNMSASIIIAGDDDQLTSGNPGRSKADEAANAGACASIFPVFHNGEQLTDFNDVHVTYGIDELKNQLNKVSGEAIKYLPLGGVHDAYFFYSYERRQIRRFTSFARSQFYGLCDRSHWEHTYPNPRGKESPIDFDLAMDSLISACKKIGQFDPTRVRGCGVWEDKGRIVLNTGRQIICNGSIIPHSRFSSNFVYVDSARRIRYDESDMLSWQEGQIIAEACQRFKWKDKRSGVYLAGWLAIARIAGALPIRPHVWLTGGAGTGKSTLLEELIQVVLGHDSERLYLNNGTTEAGLRQQLNADAIPVIFDEFETLNEGSKSRIESILDLLRQAWSQGGSAIIKGSADGTASIYRLAFCALVASIRVGLNNDADRGRFTMIELDPHGSNKEHWESLKGVLGQITDQTSVRLLSRAIRLAPVVLDNFKKFKTVLGQTKAMGQRYGDQHGMLLAGYAMLTRDDAVTMAEAEDIVNSLELDLNTEKENQIADHEECWEHLLTTKIRVEPLDEQYSCEDPNKRVYGGTEVEIGEIIGQDHQDRLATLKAYGIMVDRDHVYVAVSHSQLERVIFKGTRWERGWAKSLLRLEGAKSRVPKWFPALNKTVRCVGIPRTQK